MTLIDIELSNYITKCTIGTYIGTVKIADLKSESK